MQPLFQRTRFIMVQTSHPGNVGSAARAIKTMGFRELVLAAPRRDDLLTHPEAIALASGATDILEKAIVVDSLEQALAPISLSFALTSRDRDIGPPVVDIRQAANESSIHLRADEQSKVAIILGSERVGLENQHIELCQRICHIPANPAYSSLNVAQALQLAAWELRYAYQNLNDTTLDTFNQTLLASLQAMRIDIDEENPNLHHYASQDQVQALLTHWEQALIHIGFLNPKHPKKLMPRMRYWFNRSQLSQEETAMMRGVCSQILKLKSPHKN